MLTIENLHVKTDENAILKGLNLKVNRGEIHAIMGPNGAGKSTLAKVVAGHPHYEVKSGEMSFDGKNILDLEPNERAHLGLFMGFQYPIEIPGMTNFQFLHAALIAHGKVKQEDESLKMIQAKMKSLNISADFLERDVNSGFSGGEKKRNEILQMAVLQPELAILDETDSGLDIDALKTVADGIKSEIGENQSVILITHYQRLLEYIKPDFVHVMMNGKIVKSGGYDLAEKLELKGYDWLKNES